MAGKIIGKFQIHIPGLIEVHIRNKHSLLQSVLIPEEITDLSLFGGLFFT